MGPLKGESDHRHSLLSRPQSPITVFVHPDTKHSLLEAGKTTIMLLFIIAKALILKHVLSEEQTSAFRLRRSIGVAPPDTPETQ